MVHVYRHQNSGKLKSILTPLAPLNVRHGVLAEHIMESFLVSQETRNTIAVEFSDTYALPSVSICGVPVHSNLAQYIAYENYKFRMLKYWANRNLTHMADWEVIYLTSFKQARDKTTVHMLHFIKKFMSNNLYTRTVLQ